MPDALAERVQVSKASVAYQAATEPGRSCGTCIMYHARAGTCDLVAGRIDPGAVCSKWEEALPLTVAAAEAYLSGWALTEASWTPRLDAGLAAAVAAALEHADHPAVLEATLQLGQLDGIWQTVYDRRARLQARHERAVLAAWRTLVKALDPAVVVRAFRREAYLGETATKDPTKRWWQELGAAAALGWLRQLYQADGYDALVQALADAIRAGMAEGEAGALAVAASQQGKTGFQIDKAFRAAYDRLAADHTITQRAADSAQRLIDAQAGDIGRRLAKLAGDGADQPDMTDDISDLIDGQQAPTASTDWTFWAALGAGAMALFDLAGVGLVNWEDVGDSRECAQCETNAAGSPYSPGSVPEYPGHYRCRCSLSPADSSPLAAYFAAYLS